jgi:hypothetical protein
MNISQERPADEVSPDRAVDLIGNLHERLLDRLKTRPIRERFELEGIEATRAGTKVILDVKFRTREGPAELSFWVSGDTYQFIRRTLTVKEVVPVGKGKGKGGYGKGKGKGSNC